MKTSAIIALFLAIASMVSAGAFPDSAPKCRKNFIQNDLSLPTSQIIFNDLTSGIWATTPGENVEETYVFHENGAADIFSVSAIGGSHWRSLQWAIEQQNGQANLVFIGQASAARTQFAVRQTCEGAVFTNTANASEIVLKWRPALSQENMKTIKTRLSGEWTNVTDFSQYTDQCYGHENRKGAFLRYEFREDGTLICDFGNSQEEHHEKGNWALSADGQFLLFSIKNNEETSIGLAKINGLDDHSMNLQLLMQPKYFNDFLCSEIMQLAFIK